MNITKFAGKLLKFYGWASKKNNFYFLGHYLEGSGKYRILDRKFYNYMRDEILNRIIETIDHGCISYGNWHYGFEENNGFFSILFGSNSWGGKNDELYESIGKSKVFIGNGFFYVEDFYQFYPWCGNDLHFIDCNCHSSLRHWQPMSRMYKIDPYYGKKTNIKYIRYLIFRLLYWISTNSWRIGIPKRIYLSNISFNLFKVLCVDIDYLTCITITVDDEFFAKRGKPFYVLAKIPIWEKNNG